MPERMSFDYFYGEESEQFSFFRIPRQLITGEKFRTVSTDAKLLYGLLLDRMSLSARNGWYDEQGRVFIYYPLEEIMAAMSCAHGKAVKLLAELDTPKGIGLIERIKQGLGRPTIIYVKQFATRDLPPETPRLPKIGSPDFPKSEGSYIDLNQTDRSYTNLSIPDGMERWELVRAVRENISYDILREQYDPENLDSLVELMADVLENSSPTLRIGNTVYSAETVKGRFWKLDHTHIEYVLDTLKSTTSKIHNIRAYLLTALFNAPVTIGPYYAAKVRHDFS